MSKDKEIVDLVPGEGGVYSTESTRHSKPKEESKKLNKKNDNNDNVERLFEGMDLGLDFVESISKRIERILKLRG